MKRTLKSSLYLRACILLLLLPVLNGALSFFYTYTVSGNIAYDGISDIIARVIEFISVAVIFCGYGLLIRSVNEYGLKGSAGMTALFLLSSLIPYISAVINLLASTVSDSTAIISAIVYALINFAIDIFEIFLIILFAVLINKGLRGKAEAGVSGITPEYIFTRCCIAAAFVFALSGILQNLTVTISDITEYGAPAELNDWIYLIFPYLELAVYSVLCPFIASAAGMLGLHVKSEAPDPDMQNG